jgi:hypothetical protein
MDLSNMAMPQRIPRRPHHVDSDPTVRDLDPWHGRRRDVPIHVEELTGMRPLPAPPVAGALVAVPRSAPPTPAQALALRPAPRRLSETVELLSLPAGLREDMLPVGQPPRDAAQVRIAIVRMVRELGRDYRRWYGCALRTDAAAIERMQRHLVGHGAEVLAGRMDARSLAPEVVRHGALLGEILARRAGAVWIDVSGEQPALWQMVVPPDVVVSPIGQVHRFLLQGNREQDLVAFYFDLEAAVAGGV